MFGCHSVNIYLYFVIGVVNGTDIAIVFLYLYAEMDPRPYYSQLMFEILSGKIQTNRDIFLKV